MQVLAAVDFYAQTMTFASSDNAVQGRLKGYTKSDINLQFDAPGGNVYLNLFINNVEDRRIPTNVVPVWSSTTASYAMPRTWGLRIGYKY